MTDTDDGGRERAVNLYVSTDMSVDEIADEVGVSRTTIYTWLQAAGVSGSRRRSRASAPELDRLVDVQERVIEGQRQVVRDLREFTNELAGGIRDMMSVHFTAQTERATAWTAAIAELRREVEKLQVTAQGVESTLNNLTGVVDTLRGIVEVAIATRAQPPSGPQLLSHDE